MAESKKRYFPPKPTNREGFKEPVSWLGGRELISSLKGTLIYSLHGESIDPRPWMKANVFPPIADGSSSTANFEADVRKFWQDETRKQWEWKRDGFTEWESFLKDNPHLLDGSDDSFWFDYIADTGDGQTGVYGVGCLCLSDLWLTGDEIGSPVAFGRKNDGEGSQLEDEGLLPRGSFLFVGGDTAYHVADYEAIHERFQLPFRWAFASVRRFMVENFGPKPELERFYVHESGELRAAWTETNRKIEFDPLWDGTLSAHSDEEKFEYWDVEPLRPLFAVPANHDYYDSLDGFNRQFRRPPYRYVIENKKSRDNKDSVPLKIPTFSREQEASYTALRLPFGWSMFGIDSENEKLDFRQRKFFEQIFNDWKPKKVVIATPEPTTVFGRKCKPDDKTAVYAEAITKRMGLQQPFLNDGKLTFIRKPRQPKEDKYCRLDLSGDVHHYARYWGPNKPNESSSYASLVSGGGGAFFDSTATLIGKHGSQKGEIPPKSVYPSGTESNTKIASRITNLWTIQKGGYVQIAGGLIATIIAAGYFFVDPINDLFRPGHSSWSIAKPDLIAIAFTFVSFSFFIVAAMTLRALNESLIKARSDEMLARNVVKIRNLRTPLFTFLAGASINLLLILAPNLIGSGKLSVGINPFLGDLMLVVQFALAVIVFWIGNEYARWIREHFKLVRQSGEKPENWLNLFYDRQESKEDRSLSQVESRSLLQRVGAYLSAQSLDTLPTIIINVFGVVMVAATFVIFKHRPLAEVAANLCFAVVSVGGFIGVVHFAISTGGHYQTTVNKYLGFGLIGLVHAILQIFTPIYLLMYADWQVLLGIFFLTVFMNGLSGTGQLLKFVFRGIENSDSGWKKAVWKVASWRLAEKIMNTQKASMMLFVWILYGTLVLMSPILVAIMSNVLPLGPMIFSVYKNNPNDLYYRWLAAGSLVLLAFYIGYRFSTIWFSWYLGVASLFNGHNNEAGGAARIEGFKQILRIKVQSDKLTVYVIGFDEEKIELKDLRPKLVDKFVLQATVPANQ